MKKMILIAALAVFALGANAGCDVNSDFSGVYSVDNISVAPDEWIEVWASSPGGGYVDYMYADRPISELTASVIREGTYPVYFKYLGPDTNGNDTVPVQEQLPCQVYDGDLAYQISAEISEGYLRLVIRTETGRRLPVDKTMYFRLAIIR